MGNQFALPQTHTKNCHKKTFKFLTTVNVGMGAVLCIPFSGSLPLSQRILAAEDMCGP